VGNDVDYYGVLAVSPGAPQSEIAAAYERLARLHHPDEEAEPADPHGLRQLDEAYATLRDPHRRAAYDAARRSPNPDRPPTRSAVGWGAASSFIFSPYALAGGAVAITLAVLAALITISAFDDGEDANVSSLMTPIPATATIPPEPSVTAPATPPELTAEPVTTASGLQYIDIVIGTGASPTPEQTVRVDYTGWLQDGGTKFDSSIDRGQPVEFVLEDLIAGWVEGIQTMQVGGTRRLIVPPHLAYGAEGRTGIPPNATLIFDIDLLEVR